jgi:hypothetical protein
VRALVIGALGLSLIGCSHSLPPQGAVVACAGPDAACGAGQPMWVKAPSAATAENAARAVNISESKFAKSSSARGHARVRLAATAAKSAATAAQAASSSHIPLPQRAPQPADRVAMAQARVADVPSSEAKPAAPEPQEIKQAIQQQVAVATAAAAEQMTLATAPPAPQPKAGGQDRSASQETARRGDSAKPASAPPDNPDLLVAVLLARPDTRSVSDLAGKTIAIDDRYAKSSGTVRTAIVAAGAPEVQLSEGSTTAINRLTNGEVPAAVVALLSPDGADAFPDIKGFKIFHVPLSPRSVRAR